MKSFPDFESFIALYILGLFQLLVHVKKKAIESCIFTLKIKATFTSLGSCKFGMQRTFKAILKTTKNLNGTLSKKRLQKKRNPNHDQLQRDRRIQ